MSQLPHRAFPIVLAAPSGTGKTTIARMLVEGPGGFVFSVSATTREQREGEVDGRDYAFLDRERFQALADAGEMVEWAEVHGNLYGTPRKNLKAAAETGEHVVLDIDVQGASQIRERVPEAVLVFVFPPSADALLQRLKGRGTEVSAAVRHRLNAALDELGEAVKFDYVVVNDDLDGAVARVRGIVESERQRLARVRDFSGEAERLRNEIRRALEEMAAVPGE